MILCATKTTLRRSLWVIAFLVTSHVYGQEVAVKQAQENLVSWGYLNASPDGVMGPTTRRALREFQLNVGLPVTGQLDQATAKALSIEVPTPPVY